MTELVHPRGPSWRRLAGRVLLSSTACLVFTAPPAQAQTQSVVSACSGVSLPRSVVTQILSPVLTGITGPVENKVNGILDLPLLGGLPDLQLDTTGLLAQAAAGDPITLQALAVDGTIVGPSDQCRLTSDSITLDTPAGVAIGGNQITGLGANGAAAFASDIDAIALGNGARAEAGAIAGLALGANSSVTAANSVALGAGSVAARGALAGYTAAGLTGTQTSAGEVSVGAPGALRQLTNVAAGSAPTDAATVGQVSGVAAQIAALDALAVQYDTSARDRISLAGAGGTTLGNVAPGLVASGSREAVNGAQLAETNAAVGSNTAGVAANSAAIAGLDTRVTANTGAIGENTSAITALDGRVVTNTAAIGALEATAVRYDTAAQTALTFGGTGGTALDNVAAGALTATSSQAVNGSQLFATNTQVAANTAAIAALGSGGGSAGALRYADAATPTVPNAGTATDETTLVGASGGAVGLHNVRGGTLAAGSTDAVNGAQLFATNQAVAANTDAIGGLDTRVTVNEGQITNLTTNVTANTTAITDLQYSVAGSATTVTNLTTQVTANTTAITNLGAQLTVNTAELVDLSTEVTANSTAITNLGTQIANQPLRYAAAGSPTTPNGGIVTDDATLAGASGGPVGLHNVRDGALVTGSTDAVNGGQLAATNAQVATNTTAITNLNNLVTGSSVSPVQYSNADTPTVANGGTLTQHVTLVGADAFATVTLHNIAGGVVAAGSTDAVNGDQLYVVSTAASNSLQYDRDAVGTRTNTVTLAGGDAAAPVTLANVAAGTVSATSIQAVNGAQLYATNQVAAQAAALGANSVQYDAGGTSVTLGGSAPMTLRNIAAGTAANDAVNVAQLQAGMQGTLSAAFNYTDARVGTALQAIDYDLGRVRREIGAGTSAALAAAALPQPSEPGRSMVAIGGGTYRGQTAVALGASTFLPDGHSILKFGATVDSRGYGSAQAGYGYQF